MRVENISSSFKNFLNFQKISKVSKKNYLSDLNHFLGWLILHFKSQGIVVDEEISLDFFKKIDSEAIRNYKKYLVNNQIPSSTINRRLTTVRKFAKFCLDQRWVVKDFGQDLANIPRELRPDYASETEKILIEFTQNLNRQKASQITVKNYLVDVKNFISWLEKVTIDTKPLVKRISPAILAEYQDRLLKIAKLSPRSVNRKISSLRKFCSFSFGKGYLAENPFARQKILIPEKPPRIAFITKLLGPKIARFERRFGVPKIFFAPKEISQKGWPVWKRSLFNLRYTRPKWYTTYNETPLASYFHWAILIIFCAGLGFGIYQQFTVAPTVKPKLAVAPTGPPLYLSFQGRLTDSADTPITTPTWFTFAIYNDETASDSARLWNETKSIAPDQDGIFNTLLGDTTAIDKTIFKDNTSLWLGATVETNPEMTPRQQIATVAYAFNAEYLQGYAAASLTSDDPTATAGAEVNTIPVVNSYGNLVIAAASPSVRSTSGVFRLDAKTMYITTDPSENGSVDLNPGGTGGVNLFSGATTSNILNATSSALTTGNLLYGGVANDNTGFKFLKFESGSASLLERFTIDALGSTYIGGNLQVIGSATISGTISNATWNGSAIGVLYGGLGGDVTPAGAGEILYSTGVSAYDSLAAGNSGQLLQSGGAGAPSWVDASTVGSYYWTISNGAIYPTNQTLDLFIGGTATTSADFAFLNVDSGTPTASFSGVLTLNNSNTNYINSLGGQALSLRTSVGGDADLSDRLYISGNGNVGIGTTGPGYKLDISGDAQLSGTMRFAPGDGRLLTIIQKSIADGAGAYFNTNDSFGFQTDGTTRMTIGDNSAYYEGITVYYRPTTGVTSMMVGNDPRVWIKGSTSTTYMQWVDSNGYELAHMDGYTNLYVPNLTTIDTTDLGSESLNETDFSTHAKWDVTGDFDDTGGNATFTRSGGSGTLTQTSGNMAIVGVANRWYKFTYTVSNADSNATATITTSFAASTQTLDIDNTGTKVLIFKSAASPGNFVISATSSVAGNFILDDLSLKEIQGGDVEVYGTIVGGGGTSGIKILTSGNVGIGTTLPLEKLDISGNATVSGNLTLAAAGGNTRTISGTAGNPLSINTLVVDSSGVITTGTWKGTAIGTQWGGTGQNWSSVAQGNIPYFSGTGTMTTLSPGTAGYVLTTGGTGANPSWTDSSSVGTNYWNLASGALSPKNSTVDLLIGGTATTSAKFAFLNVNSGTPTASIAGVLTLNNSSTNYINSLSGQDLSFRTSPSGDAGLTEKMTILSSGNVGIGTTEPTDKLVIKGDANYVDSNSAVQFRIRGGTDDSLSLMMGYDTTDDFGFIRAVDQAVANKNLVLQPSGGNVGVGITNPAHILHTYAPSGSNKRGLLVVSEQAGYTAYTAVGKDYGAGVGVTDNSADTTKQIFWVSEGATIDANKNLTSAGTMKFVVNQGGNVGVGTTAPSADLHVDFSQAGESIDAGLIIHNSNSANGDFAPLWFGATGVDRQKAGIALYRTGSYGAGDLYFAVDGTADDADVSFANDTKMVIVGTTGNVGIGTTSPTSKLHVSGSATGKALSIFNETGDQNILVASASGTYKFGIDRNGNIGLAGSAPSSSNYITSPNFVLNTSGQITTGSWLATAIGTQYGGTGQDFSAVTQGSIPYFSGTGTMTTLDGAGTDDWVLKYDTDTSAPYWAAESGGGGSNWTIGTGVIYPTNQTLDLLIGGTATTSADFAFLNVNSGTPVASISGNLTLAAASGTTRTISGTAGNPLSINTLVIDNTGAITTGEWRGTALANLYGGTGQDSSGWTGVPYVSSGTWSVDTNYLAVGHGGLGGDVTPAGAGEILYSTGASAYDSLAAGTAGYVLQSGGAGAPSWVDISTSGGPWSVGAGGVLYPDNSTLDVLIGGTATTSADFAFLNVDSGTPTASFSGVLTLNNPSTNYINSLGGQALSLRTSPGGDAGLTDRLYISSSGDVGIGTTEPGAKLEVASDYAQFNVGILGASSNGWLRLYSDREASAYLEIDDAPRFTFSGAEVIFNSYIAGSDANGYLSIYGDRSASNYVQVKDSGDLIVQSGKVGIGTTSPGYTLDVRGTASISGQLDMASHIVPYATSQFDLGSSSYYWNNLYANNIYGASGGVQGYWQRTSGSLAPTNITDALNLGATATTSALIHFTGTSGGNSWINTGDVGIGTTGPGVKLDVNSNSTQLRLVYGGDPVNSSASFTVDNAAKLTISSSTQISGSLGLGGTAWSNPVGKLVVWPASATKGIVVSQAGSPTANPLEIQLNTLAVVASIGPSGGAYFAGNIGVGTASPRAVLEVVGDASSSGSLVLRGTSPSTIDILNGNRLDIQTSVGGDADLAAKMSILNSGNVGIGTTSPGASLDVLGSGNGYIRAITNSSTGYSRFRAQGDSANYLFEGFQFGSAYAGNDTLGVPNAGLALFYTGSDTTNLGFRTQKSTASIIFGAGTGAEDMRIDSSGNVGIGTTSPASRLEVNSAVTGKALVTFNETGDQNILVASASGIYKLGIDRNGNIGLAGSAPSSSNYITAPNFVLNTSGQITTGSWLATAIANTYGGTGQDSSGWTGVPYVTSGTWSVDTNYLSVGHGGLGGDVSPAGAGEILYSTGVSAYDNLAAGASGQVLVSNGAAAPSWASSLSLAGDLSVSGYATISASLAVGYNNAPAGPGNAIFSGNVGIGTTAPLEKLDVAGNATVSGNLTLAGGARTIASREMNALTLGDASTGDIQFYSSSNKIDSSGNLTIAGTLNLSGDALTSSGDLVINPTGGGVKIGTGTPGYIDLAGGDLYISGDLEVAGGTTVVGALRLINNQILNSDGTATIILNQAVGDTDATVAKNILDAGNWLIQNTSAAEISKAALIVDQQMSEDIFTASASATTKFTISNAGNLTVYGSGSHSFAGTIAPTNIAAFTLSGTITGNSQNITGLGTITFGTGNVQISGTTIGLTTDTDLLSLAADALTVNGTITETGTHSRVTRLFPEFPGAILVATGSASIGAMTSDRETQGNYTYNYYEWKSAETTAQVYEIWVKWKIPETWSSWNSGTDNALIVDLQTQYATNSSSYADAYAYKDGLDPSTNYESVLYKSSAANWDWTSDQENDAVIKFDDGTGGTNSLGDLSFSAGDTMSIRLVLSSKSNVFVRTGAIAIKWNESWK